MGTYENILETIGRTPAVRVDRMAPPGVELFVKIEGFNPGGSVKDRMAFGIIEDAERSGALRPGQTVIEATSGNTGIGLAMVCAAKGYPLVVTMAENFSVERRKLMRFLGAKVVLTPAAERGSGMLAKAIELAETHDWFLCRQFENEANPDMHTRTTAREILADFEGRRLDYWVTGFGTGGTVKGVSRVLKAERPETRVIVCEPDNSALLGSGTPQPAEGSHPSFRPHLMQGWTPDFIPKLTQDVVDEGWIDGIVPINGDDALRCSRELAAKQGIFAGISGGATMAGALRVAESAPEGSTVLCMLPDTGERYLTTELFADIPEEMTEEEWEISRSTPNVRFDVAAPMPVDDDEAGSIDPEVEAFVNDVIGDPDQPVVLFALEWCEFCWSVRKLFRAHGVPYNSVDLDSVAYQEGDRGEKIRVVLRARTGSKTIPQVYVGGELVGGSKESFEAWRGGRMQELLARNGVEYDREADVDLESLLPVWLQPTG